MATFGEGVSPSNPLLLFLPIKSWEMRRVFYFHNLDWVNELRSQVIFYMQLDH